MTNRNVTNPPPVVTFRTNAEKQRDYRERKARQAGLLALWSAGDVLALRDALEVAAEQATQQGRGQDARLILAVLPALGVSPRQTAKKPKCITPQETFEAPSRPSCEESKLNTFCTPLLEVDHE